VFGACGAAFLIRRSLFEALGGFDERFFMVYEDVDLSYRARLLGARVVVPGGATGLPDSDLHVKVAAARAGLRGGFGRIVVHVGGADEAAHRHDADAKVAFLERADRELVAPLADAVRAAGGTLRVLPDHGCDPATGAHDAFPVPCLTWRADDHAGVGDEPRRLTERAVAALRLTDLTTTPVFT
jgi:2,3-bisphosphoglycerate-independent phosphoglycerate mutase